MKCPRCSGSMTPMKNHEVSVDVCDKGCGGIFFDWLELKKMDERHESDGHFLTKLSARRHQKVNLNERMDCPKCEGVTMMRKFWSKEKSLELDECAKCGSIWLDAGELTEIYALYKTEAERIEAATAWLNEMFGENFAKLKATEETQTYRKVASVLKFVSPSYYLRKLI